MVIYITNIVSYKYVHGSYRYYGFVLGLSLAFLKLFYRRRGRDMETFSALLAICAGNSPVPGEFPHKGQWRGALIFSLLCVWINGWVKNCEAGDLGRYRAHYDVTVIVCIFHGMCNLTMCDEWVSAAKRNFSRESVLNITPQTAISIAIPVKHLEMSVQYDPMVSC